MLVGQLERAPSGLGNPCVMGAGELAASVYIRYGGCMMSRSPARTVQRFHPERIFEFRPRQTTFFKYV